MEKQKDFSSFEKRTKEKNKLPNPKITGDRRGQLWFKHVEFILPENVFDTKR